MTADETPGPVPHDESVLDALNEALQEHRLSLAVMESCTGGLLSHLITNLAGCGDYFQGGVVSYATEAKAAVGVDSTVIEKFGVVSAQTAESMASTVKDLLQADVGIGITGVAGPVPQDGTPVGIVFIAVAGEGLDESRRFDLGDNGLEENKRLAAEAAAGLLVEKLQ